LLPLNREVERYGTASLCFKKDLIAEVGFFQNLRKNADTEFLERVKTFLGDQALPRVRYPVLFQPFDGGNLTADIYNFDAEKRVLSQPNPARAAHAEAFRKHHKRLRKEQLTSHFGFPLSTMAKEYQSLSSDFLVPGYEAMDECLLILDKAPANIKQLLDKGFHVAVASEDGWTIHSAKAAPFTSDESLLDTLAEYVEKKAFFGYIVRWGLLRDVDYAKASPRHIMEKLLRDEIYASKRYGDNPSRGVDPAGAEFRAILEKSVLFHSRALHAFTREPLV
jgi:hypothetical protein